MTVYAQIMGDWSTNFGRGRVYHHSKSDWVIVKAGRYTWTVMSEEHGVCVGGFHTRKLAHAYWERYCYPICWHADPTEGATHEQQGNSAS